jgi:hypothetical protein
MTRFLRVFLRDAPSTRIQVAAFGKHPAWDDHIDDLGLGTETLVLTKQLLYSEGIASQLASGAWDQIEKSGNAIDFDHRFIWGRDQHSIVGAIWSSADRKGRTRFPLVICAQAGFEALRAIDVLLDPIERLGTVCQQAKTQDEIRDAISRAQMELNYGILPSKDDHRFTEIDASEEALILPSLVALSAGLKNQRSRGLRQVGKANRSHFRLAAISSRVKDSLSFWYAYQVAQRTGSGLPFLGVAANGREWIDLIVGEPLENDFYCLRANQNALPPTWITTESKERSKLESEAQDYLRTFGLKPPSPRPQRRSWWSALFNK